MSLTAPSTHPTRIGRYRITGMLGRGGMGTVYRGHDEALDRAVAIKVIHDRFEGVEHVTRRFGEEARAVARLSSPHIVQVYEFDPLAIPPFLAMELVRGPSVQTLIRHRGRAAVGTAADCARQVLHGLAAAHAAGIIHRDVKPANILRDDDGTYKLTDFGLARSLEEGRSLTATGSIIGTLHYLAPEVAAGHDATAASDLYSLGASLYAMLAGTAPFPDDSPLKLLRRIAAEAPTPIGGHRDDVPPAFEAWLGKLLARDPADRFPSAAAALEALAEFDAGPAEAEDVAFTSVAAVNAETVAPPPWLAAEPPQPIHRDQVDSIIRAAMRLETQGRSLLGHDTVLAIAQELNVDARFVRQALADRLTAHAPVLPPPLCSVGGASPMPLDPATRLACADAIDRLWWAELVSMGPPIPVIDDVCGLIGLRMERLPLRVLASRNWAFAAAFGLVTPLIWVSLVAFVVHVGTLAFKPLLLISFFVDTAMCVMWALLYWHTLSGLADLLDQAAASREAERIRGTRNWGLGVSIVIVCGGIAVAIGAGSRSFNLAGLLLVWLVMLPFGWLVSLRPLALASRTLRGSPRSAFAGGGRG